MSTDGIYRAKKSSVPQFGMDALSTSPTGLNLLDAGRPISGPPNDPPVFGGIDTDADEQEVIKSAIETYNHENEIRKPQEVIWDRCWRRVQNRYDHSRKSRWQSMKNLPAVTMFAYKIAWEIVKSLEKAGDKWFEALTSEPEWQPLLDVPRDLVNEFLRSTGSDPSNSFLSVYFKAIFFGIITGQVYIRTVAETDGFVDMTSGQDSAALSGVAQAMSSELNTAIPSYGFGSIGGGQSLSGDDDENPPELPDSKGFRLQFEALNGRFLYKDTNSRRRPRYLIHLQTMTRGEFREEGESRGWRYIDEVCASAMGNSTYDNRSRDVIEKDLAKDPKRLDNVYLMHYYGTLYNSNGEVVEYNGQPVRNSYFILANNKFVVWGPEPLPYWHKQIPIVIGQTLPLPGAPYSKSVLELNVEALETRVEIDNMILDYINQAINPPTEVDVDQLNTARPNQLNSGIYPGKIFEVQKAGNQGPAVTRSGQNDMSTGVFQSIGFIKQELTEFSGMADTGAMPRTRNRISAQEFKERAAASGGMIELSAKNLERDVLEPFLWQTFLVGLQKFPQPMWEAFIDTKISAQKNRTKQMPPGSEPAPPPTPPQPNPVGRPPHAMPGPQPAQPPQGGTNAAPAPATPGGPPAPEYENPELVEKLEEMKTWQPRERFQKFGALFRFSVKIYTALEGRREKLENISQLTQMAEATPGLMSRVKWHEIAEEICRALELDPERYLWANSGATAEAMLPANKDGMSPRPVSLFPPPPPNAPLPNSY